MSIYEKAMREKHRIMSQKFDVATGEDAPYFAGYLRALEDVMLLMGMENHTCKKYALTVDYGKPYTDYFNSREELERALEDLEQRHIAGEFAHIDIYLDVHGTDCSGDDWFKEMCLRVLDKYGGME